MYQASFCPLWTRRFEDRDYGAAQNPNILGSLNRYIEQAVEASRSEPPGVRTEDDPELGQPSLPGSEGKSVEPVRPTGASAGVLSDYLQSHDRLATVQPNLGEQMRVNTWEHMVAAVRLAHRGDEKGAKVRAELASNAMQEASIYMAEEEYAAFEKEVKKRLSNQLTRD